MGVSPMDPRTREHRRSRSVNRVSGGLEEMPLTLFGFGPSTSRHLGVPRLHWQDASATTMPPAPLSPSPPRPLALSSPRPPAIIPAPILRGVPHRDRQPGLPTDREVRYVAGPQSQE